MALVLEPWLTNVPKTEWDQTPVQHLGEYDFRTVWNLEQDPRFTNPQDAWHAIRPTIRKVVNGPGEWSYFATHFVSLTSEIISYLFDTRAKLKKQMKAAKLANNKLLESIADSDQRAVKIIMNSLYGMFGSGPDTGLLPCKCVAKSITSIGREELQISKDATEQKFNTTVIYGDTDSLMFTSKATNMTLQESFQLGERVSDYITNTVLQKRATLALEKVFVNLLVPKKKSYIARMYKGDKQPDGTFKISEPEQATTGTISNKLDFCDVHKDIFETMVGYMVKDGDIKKAYLYLLFSLERIANGWFPLQKFVCRNKLGNNDNAAIKTVVIRDKIRARTPGFEPKPGDIVPFVYVRPAQPKAKVLDCIEDPTFVETTGTPLGLAHYIELLQGQVECYFVRFPQLKVADLFAKAKHLATGHGSELEMAFTRNTVATASASPFPKFIRKILEKHMTMLGLPSSRIQCVLDVWDRHFVWNAVPIQYYRNLVPNHQLLAELDAEMKKPLPKDYDHDDGDGTRTLTSYWTNEGSVQRSVQPRGPLSGRNTGASNKRRRTK